MKSLMISCVLAAGVLVSACSGSNDGSAATKGTTPTDVSAQGRFERGPGGPFGPEGFVQRFDKDGNGKVELAELPEHMREHVASADTNQDGVLSLDEMKAFHEAKHKEHLAKLDTNKDGSIDEAEVRAAHEARGKEMFQKADKNGDGALTKDEVGERHWEHLQDADADKNGSVTLAELEAAKKNGTLKHGPRHGHHGGPFGPPPGDDDGFLPPPGPPPGR